MKTPPMYTDEDPVTLPAVRKERTSHVLTKWTSWR
jgi:hypothetical protein